MNLRIPVCLYFFYFYLAGHLGSQTIPYLFETDSTIFSTIEYHLEEENIDSVFSICAGLLDGDLSPETEGIALFYRGQAETLINQFDRATDSYLAALQLFQHSNHIEGVAAVFYKLGDISFVQRAYPEADSLYNLSIAIAEEERSHEILIETYQRKAAIYSILQKPAIALDFLKIALRFAQQKGDSNQIKSLLNQISTNYQANAQLDSAIIYFNKTIEWKQLQEDQEGLISDYSALGNLHKERGDYEIAQEYLIAALRIAEEERDTFSLATIHSEIGDIYITQQNWSSAEKYFQNALQLTQLRNSPFAEAGCQKRLGELYAIQNKEDSAIIHYEAALDIYQQLNSKINIADVLFRLSKLYQGGNQFEKAKTLLLEALAAREHSPDMMSTLSIKMALAEIEIEYGDPQSGIALIQECQTLFRQMEDKDGLRQSYFLLSEAYARTGQFEPAYQFYQDYSILNDSLTSLERTRVVNELEMRYTSEKKDKEIAEQKVRIEKQRTEIQIRNNQLLLLGAGLGIAGLLTTLLFFINRKNKQLNFQKIKVIKQEQETQVLKAIITGEEQERIRIAKELHDGLGAVLATVKMTISSIPQKLPSVQSIPSYKKAEDLIDDACRTVREISHNLTPYVLEEQGLEAALEDLCQTFAKSKVISVAFNYFGNEKELNDALKITLFRITQELLKNIVKHAEAKEVIVQLAIEEREIMLIVEDDGKGFDASQSYQGIGLKNILSRTAYLDGTLEIDSQIGKGSTFTVYLPLTPKL